MHGDASLRGNCCDSGVDASEAAAEGLLHSWEVAEHFGVPDELVRLRAPFFPADPGTGVRPC